MLVSQKTPFARFSVGDVSTPGAFHWTPPASLIPSNKHYKGKVVVLVDENTLSQAEYTAMAFKSVPGAIVVGSATAGSDGNVSKIPLPGGLFTLISGIGVFYPDKVPTQTIGVVPDVVVKPTLSDIIDRRDPVIEQAIKLIVGSKITDSEVRRTYQSKPTGD
jgi:C-terminal processing protease CtpA/Prc